MENKKDIGKVFREKLEGFDRTPDAKIWSAIEADLQQQKKRRFAFPFWLKTASLGVLVAGLCFLISNRNENSNGNLPQREASGATYGINGNRTGKAQQAATDDISGKANEKISEPKTATTISGHEKADSQNRGETAFKGKGGKKAAVLKKRPNTLLQQKKPIRRKPRQGIAQWPEKSGENMTVHTSDSITTAENPNPEQTNHAVANTDSAAQQTEIASEKQKDSLKIPKKESGKDSTVTRKREWQKLSVFVYGAPTFGGYFSKGSPLDKRLDQNDKQFKTTVSYGVYAVYQATEKWSLRFGISFLNLESVTRDAAINTYDYANIGYAEHSNAAVDAQTNAETMDLTQRISYTEIPLELKYALRDKKLGVNLYGGLSYLFLNKNEITARTADGKRFGLGKTANLSGNAFAFNIGIGIDYKFSGKLRANLEPVFKYHLMDYKENAAKPYTIGVLTGLQFSFQ